MNRIKVSQIQSCEVDEQVILDIVVLELKEIDTTGRNYEQTIVKIADRSGEVTFPVWKTKDSVEMDLQENMMYTLYATIGVYKHEKQLKFVSSKLLEESVANRKAVDPNFSRGITPENEKALFDAIEQKFTAERYKRYAEVALGLGKVPENVEEQEYRNRLEIFKRAWCSISHHDNYSGGLWNHTVGMIRILLQIKKQYEIPIGRQEARSEMNWDHLLLMCILHDIEKPSEHIIDGKNCYKNTETNMNHILNGIGRIDLIHSEVEKINRLSKKELEDLKYGLLCHHGMWGDYELKTPEDKVFHAIDLIDSSNVDKLKLE